MKLISRQEAQHRGLLHYHTGVPCKHGHVGDRLVSNTHCLACHTKRQNGQDVQRRAWCIQRLGGECACCGEHEYVFLTLDHVQKDGASHRRELGAQNGTRVFRWLYRQLRDGYLEEMKRRFRVLCANCNLAHAVLGYCPHLGYGPHVAS